VTSTPAKIQDAMIASLNVLRNMRLQPITQRELARAKRTLITRHDTDLKVCVCVCVCVGGWVGEGEAARGGARAAGWVR
jgi:hypothetical protein